MRRHAAPTDWLPARQPAIRDQGWPDQPGLDGLRALSIIAVLLYHGGVPWARGGFLGVEAFFVLSGFLITSLLIAEWRTSSRIRLRAFWARRARRLLPALFALVFVVGVYYTLAGPLHEIPGLKGNGLATLLYVANWHQIATGSGYFATTGPTSPLQHTWSLAIEEQFYLLWPLLLVTIFWLTGRRDRGVRRSLGTLLAVTVVATVASAIDTVILYRGGAGLDRVYYGTDTRATGLLVGASLAMGLALSRRGEQRSPARLRTLAAGAGGAAALVAVLVAMREATGQANWLFPWGFLGIDAAVAALIAAVVLFPRSAAGRIFSLRPLRAIGTISYGLYLWHFPCFLWLDQGNTGLAGTGLLALRLSVTLVVSLVSFFAIEQPVRRRSIPVRALRALVPVAAASTVAVLMMAAAVDAHIPGNEPAVTPAAIIHKLAGTDAACPVALHDSPAYRTVPLPEKAVGGYVFHWILKGAVDWNGGPYPNSGHTAFHTCPPKRVLMIGDSIAFTAGVPMLENENRYGVELADAAILGCAFGGRGVPDVNGSYKVLPPQCPDDLTLWEQAARSFRAQVVVVELGYRDEFNWNWRGRVVHLGQPAFDAYVQRRIDRFASVLTSDGARVLFMTVPFVQPPPLTDGAPAPAGSPARHVLINSMLYAAAARNPSRVRVYNVDGIVSPGNHYDETVNGQDCRFDGIHFSVYCASLLQPAVLGAARQLLKR